jgi:hypothetical protein
VELCSANELLIALRRFVVMQSRCLYVSIFITLNTNNIFTPTAHCEEASREGRRKLKLRVSRHHPLYPQSSLILPYFKHTVYSHLLDPACFILGRPHRLPCLQPSGTFNARLYNVGSSAQTVLRRV